ncbi:hypothetical protein C8R44DRAFT_897208 [Mycena epipterygia]|nr:hypothetical protein C8R44DRAFT_897208 [Mycena epipterygia]
MQHIIFDAEDGTIPAATQVTSSPRHGVSPLKELPTVATSTHRTFVLTAGATTFISDLRFRRIRKNTSELCAAVLPTALRRPSSVECHPSKTTSEDENRGDIKSWRATLLVSLENPSGDLANHPTQLAKFFLAHEKGALLRRTCVRRAQVVLWQGIALGPTRHPLFDLSRCFKFRRLLQASSTTRKARSRGIRTSSWPRAYLHQAYTEAKRVLVESANAAIVDLQTDAYPSSPSPGHPILPPRATTPSVSSRRSPRASAVGLYPNPLRRRVRRHHGPYAPLRVARPRRTTSLRVVHGQRLCRTFKLTKNRDRHRLQDRPLMGFPLALGHSRRRVVQDCIAHVRMERQASTSKELNPIVGYAGFTFGLLDLFLPRTGVHQMRNWYTAPRRVREFERNETIARLLNIARRYALGQMSAACSVIAHAQTVIGMVATELKRNPPHLFDGDRVLLRAILRDQPLKEEQERGRVSKMNPTDYSGNMEPTELHASRRIHLDRATSTCFGNHNRVVRVSWAEGEALAMQEEKEWSHRHDSGPCHVDSCLCERQPAFAPVLPLLDSVYLVRRCSETPTRSYARRHLRELRRPTRTSEAPIPEQQRRFCTTHAIPQVNARFLRGCTMDAHILPLTAHPTAYTDTTSFAL